MRTGGRGRWTVGGRMTASRRLNSSTRRVTRSSVHRRGRDSGVPSERGPRGLEGGPAAADSRGGPPAGRPPEGRPGGGAAGGGGAVGRSGRGLGGGAEPPRPTLA